jgi:putative transposase
VIFDGVHSTNSTREPPSARCLRGVEFIKGKSAIQLTRTYGDRNQKYPGQNSWARGYFVSTADHDEATIRE